MTTLYLLAAVFLPLALVHGASVHLCRGLAALPAEAQATRAYRMNGIASLGLFAQWGLIYAAFQFWGSDWMWLETLGQAIDGTLAGHPVLAAVVSAGTSLLLFALDMLVFSLAAFRVARIVRRVEGSTARHAGKGLRALMVNMLPPLAMGLAFGLMPPDWLTESFIAYPVIAGLLLANFLLAPMLLPLAVSTTRLPENDPLTRDTRQLCVKAGLRISSVHQIKVDGGKVANAMVIGLIPGLRRIYLTDHLIKEFAADEVRAILAHELGHIHHLHLWRNLVFALLGAGLIPPAEWLTSTLGAPSVLLIFFPLFALYWGVGFPWLSRRHEHQADRFAVSLTGDRASFVRALEKLATVNGMVKRWSKVDVFQTHPDLVARVARVGALR